MPMRQDSDHPAIRDAGFTVRQVDDRVTVLCLSGALDTAAAAGLAATLNDNLVTSAARRRLVLDMTGLSLISAAALRILDTHTRHLAEAVAVITAASHVREAFAVAPPPGLRLYTTLGAALADLPDDSPPQPPPGPPARPPVTGEEDLRSEVYGLRAKARSHSLIGTAQGVLYERYHLGIQSQGFDLLREASQHHNVPLRILASAVLTAPPPPASDGDWFPGRRHTPPPTLELLSTGGLDTRDRRQVLRTAVYDAITLTDADAGELHLTDPAQDHALVLEGHVNLAPAYQDSVALVSGPPAVCARARDRTRAVSVADIASDPVLADSPQGRAALAAGSRALHAEPALTDSGEVTGVITLHRQQSGPWMTSPQYTALETLAADVAAWRSWYRRTVLLDALERLHTHARALG
ncbi:ANTAR domain-containing protein [Streptomyces sp. PanSC9]|uniref:GAF and ANTAR domain-containing protein n=1 Tax=Streptomyces sp. PanSC9 TaxID=1520461 RepID=UPI000F497436|nr:ANTAR domain-containing protein [Streptomyces sp. PanSC9]ROP47399.1 GAF domain-containing protein [Streptomyces sp. PanSC9]